jgi:peptidoglycan/LPS O-acetylase OafA/YrhL
VHRVARAARSLAPRLRIELLGLAVLFAISVAFRAFTFETSSSYIRTLGRYWLPANLDLFSMGMLLAVVSAWIAERGATPTLAEWVGRIGGWWWAVALVPFWVVATQIGLSRNLVQPDGTHSFLEQYLYGLMAFLLLIPAVFGTERRGVVRSGLRWAPVMWLGLISYGIYLWHQSFVTVALKWTDSYTPGGFPHGSFWLVLAIVLACTIPTAALSYYLLEKPLQRFKYRRLASPLPPPASSP